MSCYGSDTELDGAGTLNALSRSGLLEIRTKALRRGLWFGVLSRVERTMVNLAIRVVRDYVKGALLARLMRAVVAKLGEALESQFTRVVKENGRPLAARLSRIALGWGNKSAFRWARDVTFMRYLAMLHVNSSEALS